MALSLVCHHWNDCKFLFVLFSILEHLKILYTVNILWLWKFLSGYLNSSLVKKKYTIILLKEDLLIYFNGVLLCFLTFSTYESVAVWGYKAQNPL